jgi:hypothetical protein
MGKHCLSQHDYLVGQRYYDAAKSQFYKTFFPLSQSVGRNKLGCLSTANFFLVGLMFEGEGRSLPIDWGTIRHFFMVSQLIKKY